MKEKKKIPNYDQLAYLKDRIGLKNMTKEQLMLYKQQLKKAISENRSELIQSSIVEAILLGLDVSTLYLAYDNIQMMLVVNAVAGAALVFTGANIGKTIYTYWNLKEQNNHLSGEISERIRRESETKPRIK